MQRKHLYLPLSRVAMLRVFKASSEGALATAFTDSVREEEPVRVLVIKRYFQHLTGQLRFKQQLVSSDGQMLADDVVLHGPMDLQLILRPFEPSSQDQTRQFHQTAGDNNTPGGRHAASIHPLFTGEMQCNPCVFIF